MLKMHYLIVPPASLWKNAALLMTYSSSSPVTNKRCLIKTENPPLPLPESVLGEKVGNFSDHKTDNASIFNVLNLFVLSHQGKPVIPACSLSDITFGDSYLPLQTQPPLKASAATSWDNRRDHETV